MITSLSTSSRLDSIYLAMTGNAASVSGTTAAFSPIDVPTIARVTGDMATINIMTGNDRIIFITKLMTAYNFGFGRRPNGDVITGSIAAAVPIISPKSMENPSIRAVENMAGTIIFEKLRKKTAAR